MPSGETPPVSTRRTVASSWALRASSSSIAEAISSSESGTRQSQLGGRVVQALEVLGEQEGRAAHGAQQVEDRVAAQESDVERGDCGLLGGNDLGR